ncbi:hypothetical protein D3C77_364430 [compost metagenome]
MRQVGRHDDRLTVHAQDHVTHLQATLGCRAIFQHLGYQGTGRLVQAKGFSQVLVDLLDHHAQPAAADLAVFLELVGYIQRNVDRDGERQAHEATGTREDLRVDTHHLAVHVEQRATGVTGVDRNVGLDERHIGVVGQGTALGADDTFGHRVVETERRADRQHPLTHFQLAGVAQLDGWQVLAFDLEQGHVGTRVSADQLGLQFAAVGQADDDFVSVGNHMVVGQYIAIVGDDEARTQGLRFTLAVTAWRAWVLRHVALEELAEHRRQAFKVWHLTRRVLAFRQLLLCRDVHYSRRSLLDQGGEVRQGFGLGGDHLTEHEHGGEQR